MAHRQDILVLSIDGDLDALPGRLLLNHFRGRTAQSLEEAEKMLAGGDPPMCAGILATHYDFRGSAATLGRLREAAGGAHFRLVAAGDPPSDGMRAAMRVAGIDFLLTEPFADSELRFVLNQATWDVAKGDTRVEDRVPTELVARVRANSGTKVATVYNLSIGGAYLETPRPSQEGSRLEVVLPVPGSPLELQATVLTTNVTGNLRKENLPRGMGVRFDDPTEADSSALLQFIEERLASFRP